MTAIQLAAIREAIPFREFDLLLADGRQTHVEHPDLLSISSDRLTATVYCRPDVIEYLDLAQVVSARVRAPELFDDEAAEV